MVSKMNLKSVFKSTLSIAAKHRDIFLVFSFVYSILIFATLFLGSLGGLTLVLSVFVFLPIQFSFYIIAKKMIENKPIIPQDFYFGFRSILTSLVIGSKMMFRGFLNGLLSFIIVLLIGGIILSGYLINNYPTLIEFIMNNTSNIEAISVQLDAYPSIINLVILIYIVAAIAATILYMLSASKFSIAPLIMFEAPFDINSAIKMSKDINKKNGNLNLLIYGVFFVVLTIILIGVFLLTNYLFNAGLFEDLILVALIFLMLSLLIAPLNILFVIAKTSYYQLFAKAQVNTIIEELKKSASKAKKDE
jgi:hypothetical protein